METLPLWVQLLALFGVPAVGVYTGLRVGLAEMRGEHTKLEVTTNLKFAHINEWKDNTETELKILRKRTHAHGHAIGRLAMKVSLTGFHPENDEDENNA